MEVDVAFVLFRVAPACKNASLQEFVEEKILNSDPELVHKTLSMAFSLKSTHHTNHQREKPKEKKWKKIWDMHPAEKIPILSSQASLNIWAF